MSENIEDSSSSCDETLIDEEDLNKFTSTLDQYTPAIPETVTKYYMRQCGLQTDDDRVVKLLSVSVQKFMTDIINDCFQLHKIREKSTNRPGVTTSAVAAANAQPPTTEATTTTTDQSTNAASGKKPIASTNQTLTLNDLTHVLGEYGINVKKTFYYT
ncbi:unnamed protein product [Rotaria sordida]|uniref:Transcription initiation factor TFIID subunit 10 n=1 Tax=Rotaria sordida TaxID=392033 RepID=A0A815QNS0_9BILA|nr:unnamed protein product [Rotaria sordida]CAF1337450.1 unnamed protein product [Rotaria sordida]CAF1464539.1 unnamed protein product [Rotaria sordida]CAF3863081.1 unnamed protein product [Rotaria sordida]